MDAIEVANGDQCTDCRNFEVLISDAGFRHELGIYYVTISLPSAWMYRSPTFQVAMANMAPPAGRSPANT